MRRILLLALLCIASMNAFAQWAAHRQWVRTYNGPTPYSSTDAGKFVIAAADGNIYSCGYSNGGTSNYDLVVIKYTPSGDTLWMRRFNNPQNNDDVPITVKSGDSSQLYVLLTENGPGYSNFRVLKYSSAGLLMWAVLAPNMWENGNNLPIRSLDTDPLGNVYITGSTMNTTRDYCVIKYNASGDTVWRRTFAAAGQGSDNATALKCDPAGNVYVTGSSWNGADYDYLTLKYNTSGVLQWQTSWNGPSGRTDYPYDLDLDPAGNLYVTGECYRSPTTSNTSFGTLKYNGNGTLQWVRYFDAPDSLSDRGQMCRVVSTSLYVSGTSYGSSPTAGGTGNDFCLVKYDLSGVQQWTARFNGSGNDEDILYGMDTDSLGNILLAGDVHAGLQWKNFGLVCYSPAGTERWRVEYDSAQTGQRAYGICCGTSSSVYLTGIDNYNMSTIKFIQSPVTGTGGQDYTDMEIFPNPATDALTIRLIQSSKSPVLNLYGITGNRIVTNYVQTSPDIFRLSTRQLPSGCYLLELITESGRSSRLVMVRH